MKKWIAGSRWRGAEASPAPPADPEVPAQARRRTYMAEYKLQILKQADMCKEPGQLGFVIDQGRITDARPGMVVRGPGYSKQK